MFDRPSVQDVIRSPELYNKVKMSDYSYTDGVRVLAGRQILQAQNDFYKKSRELHELSKDKNWINNLISRINNLSSREEKTMGRVDLFLPKPPKDSQGSFLSEKNLQMAHRMTTLIEELNPPTAHWI